mgnify:CR=1 FL=1
MAVRRGDFSRIAEPRYCPCNTMFNLTVDDT